MEITFISWPRFWFTLAVMGTAIAVYVWKIRPALRDRPEFKGFYDHTDTRCRHVFEWLKLRWDMTLAAILALAPIAWNGALDAVVAVSLLLGDLLSALAGVDLSALVLPPWLKTIIQIGGAVVPVLRNAFIKNR